MLDENMGVFVEDSLEPTSRAVFKHPPPMTVFIVSSTKHARDFRLVEQRPQAVGDLSGTIAKGPIGDPLESAGNARQRTECGDRWTGERIQRDDLGQVRGRTSQIGWIGH